MKNGKTCWRFFGCFQYRKPALEPRTDSDKNILALRWPRPVARASRATDNPSLSAPVGLA
jgi:hypothetical protein